jgi:predicted nuclease of predicted toxin-antitoxin system
VSRPRFLADHDLNESIVDGVCRREPLIEFIRAREVGLAARPDPEVLHYAAQHGLIVVSHDVNTMPAHASQRLRTRQTLPGLVMVRQTLVLLAAASAASAWRGRVCRADRVVAGGHPGRHVHWQERGG